MLQRAGVRLLTIVAMIEETATISAHKVGNSDKHRLLDQSAVIPLGGYNMHGRTCEHEHIDIDTDIDTDACAVAVGNETLQNS